jgi:hypothetical protein
VAQLGHGGGDVVDHPAAGLALRAGRAAKAAQVDGERAQAPLGQVVGEGPEATEVGRVLVGEHHPGRAAADDDPVQAGPIGRLEAEWGCSGGGWPASGARLLQGLQRGRGRAGRPRAGAAWRGRPAVGAGGARAGAGDQHGGREGGGDPAPPPALVRGLRLRMHDRAPRGSRGSLPGPWRRRPGSLLRTAAYGPGQADTSANVRPTEPVQSGGGRQRLTRRSSGGAGPAPRRCGWSGWRRRRR